MVRMRSPSYPSLSLKQAIELVRQIHASNRTNVIDRESAARDMGYSGITGRSLKVLAALLQFGLLSKAGKGEVKVTQTAVDILHGIEPQDRNAALLKAGTAPALFQELHERFPDGPPSENAIRSYLIQQGFADVAIGPAITAYMDTYHHLENISESESHGGADDDTQYTGEQDAPDSDGERQTPPPPPPPPAGANTGGYRAMEGERIVFSEEIGIDNYLKLVASGDMNIDLLDALSDFIERQKRRIERTQEAQH